MAWTADELYGRDSAFLDGLDELEEAFVVEVPTNAHVWLTKPKVLKIPPPNSQGRSKKYPRLRKRDQQPHELLDERWPLMPARFGEGLIDQVTRNIVERISV
jgi:hypothetical protein